MWTKYRVELFKEFRKGADGFIDILKSIDKTTYIEEQMSLQYADIVTHEIINNNKNMYEAVEEILKPTRNDFMHYDYDEMQIVFGEDMIGDRLRQYGKEVWTDSKCLYNPRVLERKTQMLDFNLLLRKLEIDEDKINLLSNII